MFISQKKLGILLLAFTMQGCDLFAMKKLSGAVFNWNMRIDGATDLKDAIVQARAKDKPKAKEALASYCNDQFGSHGRLLRSELTEDQKQKVFDVCGTALKDKNPQAYAAVQEAQISDITKTKSNIGKKSSELASEASGFASGARAIKEREKAKYEEFEKLPWYKQLVS